MTELRRWRERRAARKAELRGPKAGAEIPKLSQKSDSVPVRGYDSPKVFRDDALERIERLEKKISRDLRDIEHWKAKK